MQNTNSPQLQLQSQKSILISGASTGIGRCIALHFDKMGYQVFAGVRKAVDGEALKDEASSQLQSVMLDVLDSESVNAALEIVSSMTKTAPLMGVVNNAGIAITMPMEFVPLEMMQKQLDVNVMGVIRVTQAFLPLLRKNQGRIINMSSMSGRQTLPFFGPYAASKYALEAISDALRMELWPHNVKVVLIEPGPIRTPIWEKSAKTAEAAHEKLDPSCESLYGPAQRSIKKMAMRMGEKGAPVQDVANAVELALESPHPKPRYMVNGSNLSERLSHLFPDQLLDWLKTRYLRNKVWKKS
jgi:NAD(P)-dependent dehydrogenase (short-subunit alcohol dehydrogenase family)